MDGNLRVVFVLIFEWMDIHPRLARAIEDPQKKEMHIIGFSRRSCDLTMVVTIA